MDKTKRQLEVGVNAQGEVVINHPDLKPDADGVGHIIFSPDQARSLAALLTQHADSVEPKQGRQHTKETPAGAGGE